MTPIVLDASAGVELALQTPIGRRLHVKLPAGAVSWVPEHYFVEAVAVLRRLELHRTYDEVRSSWQWIVAKHLNASLVTTGNKLAAAPTLPVATITP